MPLVICWPTSCSLSIRFQEHIRYIRDHNSQSANTQHILQNQHEYDQLNSIMTLLKALNNPRLFIPYEQYYIQFLHPEGNLIPEQNPGEINPLFKTVINPQPLHSTWSDQLCFSLLHGYHPNPAHQNSNTHQKKVGAISNLQHQSTLAKHHHSTNKTHCTHENT